MSKTLCAFKATALFFRKTKAIALMVSITLIAYARQGAFEAPLSAETTTLLTPTSGK